MIQVLYVDDETTLLELCKLFLERSGDFTVTIATSAPEAIRILGQERFDAIVSDYQMPEMDGIEFLKHFKGMGHTTPFIIFTGKGREEIAVEAFESGADGYLQKGGEAKSQFAELSHKIKKAVDGKRAEEESRKNEARFRSYFNMPVHGIAITSLDKGWLEVNDRICSMLGYTRDELFHKNWAELTHPDDLAADEEQFNRVLSGQIEQYTMDKRFIRKDGGIIWTTITIGCVRKSDGNVDYIIGQMDDITNRRHAEEALRESEERYHSILDSMQDVYFRADAEGLIIMASPSAAHLFRYDSVNDLIGIPAASLYRHPKERQEIIRIVMEQGGVQDFICEAVRKDGTSFWVSMNVQFTFDNKGSVTGTDGFIRDITERKRTEEALRQANKKLNLLSSITRHDIINQLMALRGYLELSHEMIGKQETLSKFIEKEQQAANTIENQILFTRNYQDLGVADPVWQNVNASIKKAVAGLPMRDVHVVPDPADPEMYADPLLEKVFYNLIDNALRYGGDQMKTIRISSQESDGELTIICEDDGMGIMEEDKQRIFIRGFGKNTGLGLFLSQEILSIAGTTITENGVPGKGARFEITVPKGVWRMKGANE